MVGTGKCSVVGKGRRRRVDTLSLEPVNFPSSEKVDASLTNRVHTPSSEWVNAPSSGKVDVEG